MDLAKILRKVGASIFSSVVPGGGIILDAVNAVLPKEKKLGNSATGADIETAIKTLPPDKQVELLSKKFNVEIVEIQEWSKVVASLAEADKTGRTTRPKIANRMAWLIAGSVSVILFIIAWAVLSKNHEMMKAIGKAWPFIMFLIGIPAGIVNSYFGKRTKEKQSRYSTASGVPMAGGIISDIITALRR